MKPTLTSSIVAMLVVASLLALALNLRAAEQSAAAESDHGLLVERGRYLVNNVGMCSDCHTPRNERGEFVKELWLQGSPLGITPNAPMPWAPAAPPIAGLHGMNDAQAIEFLQTGLRPNGSRPLPPMPEFRFVESDARAVVAYLRTLSR
jgi:mono/diheme cytochrome c family protein